MNKRLFLQLLHLLMVSVLTAQTSSENYVHIRKYLSSDSSQWYLTLDCGEVSLSGSTSASSYYFDLKDYQGNVRMAVRSDTSSPFVTDYYPYGGVIRKGKTGTHHLLFIGKELNKMHALNWYDFGARMYDPSLGRFTTMDPLAENDYSTSPYVYCGNDPVNRIDKDGRIWDTVLDLAFVAYDAAEATYQYCTTGSVSNTTKAALTADVMAAAVPGLTGTGLAVRMGAKAASKSVEVAKGAEKALQSTSKGARVEKLHKSAEIGQEAHRQIEKELTEKFGGQKEVPMRLNDGTRVRKDFVKPDGTSVIIKPETPSGYKSAKKREKLMQKNGKRTETLFYNPNDKKYLKDSPTYIGPYNK